MRDFLLIRLLLIVVFGIVLIPEAIARKKKKIDAEAVPVTLYLNKIVSQSKSSIVKGYLRSAIVNDPTFFEVSETPQGERIRYISEDIDSLIVMDKLKYVKRKCKNIGFMAGKPKIRWVRIEYDGNGIDVYSAFFVIQNRVNNITTVSREMYYYFSIDKDIAIFTSRQYLSAPYVIGTPAVNRTQMAYYFCKIYDYPEFALRIKAKEFEDMMSVVKSWETEYGDRPVKRVAGKIENDQLGVQNSITVVSGTESASWKRVKNEVVFPQYMRTMQIGIAPDIAPWSRKIKHGGNGYNWEWDNGYGPKTKATSCNRFDICAGLSWHLTLCHNFEFYARLMMDLNMTGNRTIDCESGEKMIAESNMDTSVSGIAIAGLRYYFCKKVGVYVESGYDIGYVSGGFSFRF